MKLRGEDTAEAYREWFKAEIREGLRQRYELGKFFFSVSVGTAGVLAALGKLDPSAKSEILIIACAIFLFISVLLALSLAVQRTQKIPGGAELDKVYLAHTKWITIHVWGWFILWLIGIVLGGIAIVR